jgi:Putative zinc-finger
MSCVDVRERLPEHALGVLGRDEATEVDRHLEWCVACRKESEGLREGIEVMGASLPPVDPSPLVERRVVEAVMGTEWLKARRRHPSRTAVRLLVVAALAAGLVAVGSLGWGLAQRNRADTLKIAAEQRLHNFQKLVTQVREANVGARPLQSQLRPGPDQTGLGEALVLAAPRGTNWVVVDMLPLSPDTSPYQVQLVDRSGNAFTVGRLLKSTSGDLILVQPTTRDLSNVITVSIIDRGSRAVMTGSFRPYPGT